ncbi:hypothetical protein BJ166DRAFT_372169 [Pestalotiopsis sp. NC0098]|nr:hypothetical protein BJ166DRAFT_372169 [Pestalotiopsis sp. NC0098]
MNWSRRCKFCFSSSNQMSDMEMPCAYAIARPPKQRAKKKKKSAEVPSLGSVRGSSWWLRGKNASLVSDNDRETPKPKDTREPVRCVCVLYASTCDLPALSPIARGKRVAGCISTNPNLGQRSHTFCSWLLGLGREREEMARYWLLATAHRDGLLLVFFLPRQYSSQVGNVFSLGRQSNAEPRKPRCRPATSFLTDILGFESSFLPLSFRNSMINVPDHGHGCLPSLHSVFSLKIQ